MAERNGDGTFKKGHSGNPKGRKPRVVEAATLAQFKALVSPADLKAITRKVVGQAKDGHLPSVKLVFAYLWGQPRQTLDIAADIMVNTAYEENLELVYEVPE